MRTTGDTSNWSVQVPSQRYHRSRTHAAARWGLCSHLTYLPSRKHHHTAVALLAFHPRLLFAATSLVVPLRDIFPAPTAAVRSCPAYAAIWGWRPRSHFVHAVQTLSPRCRCTRIPIAPSPMNSHRWALTRSQEWRIQQARSCAWTLHHPLQDALLGCCAVRPSRLPPSTAPLLAAPYPAASALPLLPFGTAAVASVPRRPSRLPRPVSPSYLKSAQLGHRSLPTMSIALFGGHPPSAE